MEVVEVVEVVEVNMESEENELEVALVPQFRGGVTFSPVQDSGRKAGVSRKSEVRFEGGKKEIKNVEF